MTYKRLPSDLPKILRSHGLKVVQVDGWQDRGRPASTGNFDPVGVLCHDTVTGSNVSDKDVVHLLVNGRSDLPGPLAQFGLARDGTVYIIASGRCNHAGVARPHGSVVGGDGNTLYMGVEAFNDGVHESWSKTQYDAYVLLAAVLSVYVTKNSVRTVSGHKETSITGKVDPTFDMDAFRTRVQKKMGDLQHPKATRISKFVNGGTPYDVSLLDAAIKAGRTGTVKRVRDGIEAQIRRLPQHEHNTRISKVVDDFDNHRLLRMGSLNNAVKGGRVGVVKSVRDEIQSLIHSLPKS
jgi:hypothetical protein